MRLRIKKFELSITYPALCLFSCLIIIDYSYFYCILSVIIHESAHIIAMIILSTGIACISISVFDIKIIESSRHRLGLYNDMIITSAGPLSNIIVFILFFCANNEFALVNLFIGLFNALPAASLDGGQLIYLILSKRFSRKKSSLIVDIITITVSIPIFIIGFFVLLQSKYNFSLLFISLYLLLSVFFKKDKYL